MFTGTIKLISKTLKATLNHSVEVFFPVTFDVKNNLPGVKPTKYPGSGSHLINGYLGSYASVQLKGKPNTEYYFDITFTGTTFDASLVQGTINNWKRIYEWNNSEDHRPCTNSDPIGTACYLSSGFNKKFNLTTDNNGFLSLLFLHCAWTSTHHIYLNLNIYEKRKDKYVLIGSSYVYSE